MYPHELGITIISRHRPKPFNTYVGNLCEFVGQF